MDSFTTSITALVLARDTAFIERVAKDYNLNLEELRGKYLDSTSGVVKAKRPYNKRKATVVVLGEDGEPVEAEAKKAKGERPDCKGITAKKEPCKFSALKGGCFCLRHQKAHDEAEAAKAAGVDPSAPKPKVPKAPKVVVHDPVHTHGVDGDIHADCNLCQTHGPIFGGVFEVEEAPLEDRLNRILETAKSISLIPEAVDDDEEVDSDPVDEDEDNEPVKLAPRRLFTSEFVEEEFSEDAGFPDGDL